MVVTKVKQIKSVRQLGTAVKYVADDNKVLDRAGERHLKRTLTYIENPEKTLLHDDFDGRLELFEGGKERHLVDSYGIIDPDSATEEFLLTLYNCQ